MPGGPVADAGPGDAAPDGTPGFELPILLLAGFRTLIDRLHRELVGRGVAFTRAPSPEHGVKLAEFVDSEGARCSLSG